MNRHPRERASSDDRATSAVPATGRYSRRRLAAIAVGWLVAAVAVAGVAPGFGAVSQDPQGCDGPSSGQRCAFPAEANVGGIVMGTDFIQGSGLKSFGVGDDPPLESYTPPGRVQRTEPEIYLGLNDVTATQFFIYKMFYYRDARVGDDVPMYIWSNATSATLSGSSECGDGTRGPSGADNCDLVTHVSELSTGELQATTSCSGTACSLVPGTLTSDDYWTVRPEEDTCGAVGALSGAVCLGLIPDGDTTLFGTTVSTDTVTSEDFMVRGHEFTSTVGPSDGADKTMTLDNMYLEVRYGVGYDRHHAPQSLQNPGSGWAQPVQDTYGRAAIANPWQCQGGGPATFCAIPPNASTDIDGMGYPHIHEPGA